MIERPIHKLIQPLSACNGIIEDLILCGRTKIVDNRMRFSSSINDCDCIDCWDLWHRGVYNWFSEENEPNSGYSIQKLRTREPLITLAVCDKCSCVVFDRDNHDRYHGRIKFQNG